MQKINYNHSARHHVNDSANEILPFLFNKIDIRSVLDVGCGTGKWLEVSEQLGANDIFGLDGIELDSESLRISKQFFLKHDFSKVLNLNRKFDLVLSLEVAEHLPESAADNFIQLITTHGDVVLFSAAIPKQGGQHHLNEQWPSYWAEKFLKRGYVAYDDIRPHFWNNKKISVWYRQNIILYAKPGFLDSNKFTPVDYPLPLVHPELYLKRDLKVKYIKTKGQLLQHLKMTLKEYTKRLMNK